MSPLTAEDLGIIHEAMVETIAERGLNLLFHTVVVGEWRNDNWRERRQIRRARRRKVKNWTSRVYRQHYTKADIAHQRRLRPYHKPYSLFSRLLCGSPPQVISEEGNCRFVVETNVPGPYTG